MNDIDLKNNRTITIMYHYVKNKNTKSLYNPNYLNIDKFKKQLDWLEKNFEPLCLEELESCITHNKQFPYNKFLLTFDDGLKDHYKYVFPELKKRKLWGMFFINSQVYMENKPLGVHITHALIEKIGIEKYTTLIKEELNKYNIEIKDSHIEHIYRYDDPTYSSIKKIMNYLLDYQTRDKILDDLFINFFYDEKNFCKNYYCTEDELQEMLNCGMIIGAHSHSHKILSRLSRKEQYSELKKSKDYIKDTFDIKNLTFCFPYGHKQTYNADTLDILAELDYYFAFNTYRDTTCIKKSNKYELQRYDTVDLYPTSKGIFG